MAPRRSNTFIEERTFALFPLLAQIGLEKKTGKVMSLARTFLLPVECFLIFGDYLHLEVMAAVFKAMKKEEIKNSRQICRECIYSSFCASNHRN